MKINKSSIIIYIHFNSQYIHIFDKKTELFRHTHKIITQLLEKWQFWIEIYFQTTSYQDVDYM